MRSGPWLIGKTDARRQRSQPAFVHDTPLIRPSPSGGDGGLIFIDISMANGTSTAGKASSG